MNGDRIWPDNASCAAMVSVNLDAEFFARIFYPDADVDSGEILSLGRTSMSFGLPKLLDVLEANGVRATVFVPGAVAERYPEAVRGIAVRGHEIGCHGYMHENMAQLSIDEQRVVLSKAVEVLTRITGKRPVGFRMPEGEMTDETLVLVKELGFRYSSSLSDDDVPYIRQPSGLVELPIQWQLYDLPYFTFTFDPPIPPGQARGARMDDVLQNWRYELTGAMRWGTLFNLQLDPQAIGEQGRIFMLERLLEQMREGGVWIAAGDELAEYWQEKKDR